MSITDDLMWRYYELLSRKSLAEIEALRRAHPKQAKSELAKEIVTRYHGAAHARLAEEQFELVHKRREVPEEVEEREVERDAGADAVPLARTLSQLGPGLVGLGGAAPDRPGWRQRGRRARGGPEREAFARSAPAQGREAQVHARDGEVDLPAPRKSWGAKSDAPRRDVSAAGRRRGVHEKFRQRPTLPHGNQCSTIGSEGLNFRVRDGNGWSPSDIATGNFERDRRAIIVSARATMSKQELRSAAEAPRSTLAFAASRRIESKRKKRPSLTGD